MYGPAVLRITFRTGLGGGVLAVGLSWSESAGGTKTRSPASWYFASHSVRVWGTGGGDPEEVFKGVVVEVGRLSILISAWMIVGGGGGTTVGEVDDLQITGCGIGDLVFLNPYLNQLSGFPT